MTFSLYRKQSRKDESHAESQIDKSNSFSGVRTMKRFVLASLLCLLSTTVRADLIVISDALSAGGVNSHLFAASSGELITVSTWSLSFPDTVLGLFRPDASLVDSNDDDNPGVLSALRFTADATGTWSASVTGYPDFDFIGDHAESGPYSLVVSTSDTGAEVEQRRGENDSIAAATALAVRPNGGSRMGAALFAGDVDFYSFSASAGSLLTAEVHDVFDGDVVFDSILGLFDNLGAPLLVDDD